MSDRHEKAVNEELVAKVRRRVALEEKAHRIVVELSDSTPSEDQLLDQLQRITPEQYSDVVEERCINSLCGYPRCNNRLTNVPKQTFWISVKSKTVYDISERKKFCSNFCLAASHHLQSQIPSSPVWLRGQDPPVQIKLMQKTAFKGLPGKVVVTRRGQNDLTDEVCFDDDDGHSSNRTRAAYSDAEEDEDDEREELTLRDIIGDDSASDDDVSGASQKVVVPLNEKRRKVASVVSKGSAERRPIPNDRDECQARELKDTGSAGKRHEHLKTCIVDCASSVCTEADGNSSAKHSRHASSNCQPRTTVDAKKVEAQKDNSKSVVLPVTAATSRPPVGVIYNVKNILFEWRTPETARLLTVSSGLSDQVSLPTPSPLASSVQKNKVTKEADSYAMKVKEFYGENVQEKDVTDDVDGEIVIPPVHSCSQMLLRRQIVLERLGRVLPDLFCRTGTTVASISSAIRSLVHTFNLSSRNILLRHDHWVAVGYCLMKVLATKDGDLKKQLETVEMDSYVRPLLSVAGLSERDVDEIVDHMTTASNGDDNNAEETLSVRLASVSTDDILKQQQDSTTTTTSDFETLD